jgi:uncharacterized protein YwgA
MKPLARSAMIANLRQRLEQHGNWTGETHLQKATYLLQEAAGVPLEYTFILYKHGPFSFDLRDHLTEMRADGLIKLSPQPPYGPKLEGTQRSDQLVERFPKTLRTYEAQLAAVADFVGNGGVSELERLATAVMLINENPTENDDVLATRLQKVKPHISGSASTDSIVRGRHFLESLDATSGV